MNIYEIFLMFWFYAVLGWMIEVAGYLITDKCFINRGFLIGPYCPIYGVGGVLITFFLTRYYENPITLFVMAMTICAVLEYVTSYIMEKLFNARWWDYTKYKYNINGRICLETMIPFGLLGCIVIYLTNPVLYKIFSFITPFTTKMFFIIFLIIFVIDVLVSFKIIRNFKIESLQFRNKDNTEEITKKVKEILYKKSPFTKRLMEAFPDVKSVLINIKNELKRTKSELTNVKKDLKKTEKKLEKAEKQIEKGKKSEKKRKRRKK